ncbi:MAG TPA: hypothetical protein VNL16_05255 [Chloroflexota bacterium]|nr:hypothetical protein [Chloroflexota bacterium]
MALTIVSDLLFVVYFSVPVLALVGVAVLISRGRASRQMRFLLSTVVVTVLSALVYWWITPAAASYTAAIGLEQALESATTLSQDITLALALDPLFVIVVLLIPLGYVLVYLVARVVRATPGGQGSRDARSSQQPGSPIRRRVISPIDGLASYVVASCLATLAFVLGCHLYVNGATLRYLAPLVYSPVLVVLLAVGLLAERAPRAWTARGRWIAGSGVIAAALGTALSGPGATVPDLFPAPADAACFAGIGSAAGLADYWDAKPLIMFSGHRLQVAAVVSDGTPFLWADNAFWYVESWMEPGHPPRFSFIVMRRLDPTAIARRYGQPDRVVACAGSAIWWYDQPNALGTHLVQGNPDLLAAAASVQASPSDQGGVGRR